MIDLDLQPQAGLIRAFKQAKGTSLKFHHQLPQTTKMWGYEGIIDNLNLAGY